MSDFKTIAVYPYDKSYIKPITKAINDSKLDLNASIVGTEVHIPIPLLTNERRKELLKIANRQIEENKVALRTKRKLALDNLRSLTISKDIIKKTESTIDTIIKDYSKELDSLLIAKEKEILL